MTIRLSPLATDTVSERRPSPTRSRVFWLVVILLAAFALRIHAINSSDFNVDEAWSYWHAYHLSLPDAAHQWTQVWALGDEPNNAFHIILTGITVAIIPNPFALRWFSLLCGIITVALSARIAYRLMGNKAVLPTAFVVAAAFTPLSTSQIGRPYALETTLVAASFLSWLERKRFTNLVTSVGAVLAHIGALPIILLQEILSFAEVARKRRRDRYAWLINRIIVYGTTLGIIFLVRTREASAGRGISFGQPLPNLNDFIHWGVNTLFNGLMDHDPWNWLILIGYLLPLCGILIYLLYRKRLSTGILYILLWIFLSCITLIVIVLVGHGAIKFLHLSHVAIAFALLTGVLWAKASRPVARVLLVVYCGIALFVIADYYAHPYKEFSQITQAIHELRKDNAVFYSNDEYIHRALVLSGAREDEVIYRLPPPEQRSAHYWFINYDWGNFILPDVPAECNPTPVRIIGGARLHPCR